MEKAFQLIHELFNRGEDDDQLKLAENQLKITIRDKFVRYAEVAVNDFYRQRMNRSVDRLSRKVGNGGGVRGFALTVLQDAQNSGRKFDFSGKLRKIASDSRKFAINVLHRGETVQPERQQE